MMTALAIGLWVIAGLWLLLIAGERIRRRKHAPFVLEASPVDSRRTQLPVAVIVPARNESHNIGTCVRTLATQRPPLACVRVVDDRSSDGTADVARQAGVSLADFKVVEGTDPPKGWAGKVNALVRGVESVPDEITWMLFVDADVALAPDAIATVVERAEADQIDLLSAWGRWIMPSFGVRLLQPVVGAVVRGTAQVEHVNDPARREAFANGQFILIHRRAYTRIGGWASVKDRVLEDVAFARVAKKAGLRLGMFYAESLMEVVPYRGLGELWNGYRKNLVEGAGGRIALVLLAALVFITSLLPLVAIVTALAIQDVHLLFAGWGAILAAMYFRIYTAPTFHHRAGDAFFHPVANFLFFLLLLHAAVSTRVPWKGRVLEHG